MITKKLNIILLLICIGIRVNAQTEKGKFMTGGTLDLSMDQVETYGKNKGFGIQLYPNIGYFVINKLALGINGELGYYLAKKEPQNYTGSIYGGDVWARYYALRKNKHGLFAQTGYGMVFNNSKDGTMNPDFISTTITEEKAKGFDISLGYDYFITPNVSLEIYYEYSFFHELSETRITFTEEDPFGSGIITYTIPFVAENDRQVGNLHLGLQIYF